ncbi:unnamed protein product [Moneuplotes crassus]|uniref:HD domain-containing protein n=1 Tax=Euplotes crassus TaxID=5936 RepID=A0AAD1U675_EUPCR|nr:unnamed protein product [Moneuplotes crassus]
MDPSPPLSFTHYFPLLHTTIVQGGFSASFKNCEIEKDLRVVYAKVDKNVFRSCKKELKAILGESLIACLKHGYCHLHSLIVTYNIYEDERFGHLNDELQNQLLWAGLCHDLGKRGEVEFKGKDHIHPFRSAAYFIDILKNNNLIKDELRDKADELSELVFNAHTDIQYEWFLKEKEDSDGNICDQMHDHDKLDDIFKLLEEVADGDLFIKNVFVVILFHQSIYGIKDYFPMKCLEDKEIIKYREYLSEDVLNMLDIFMHCDSYAYSRVWASYDLIQTYQQQISDEIKRIKADVLKIYSSKRCTDSEDFKQELYC